MISSHNYHVERTNGVEIKVTDRRFVKRSILSWTCSKPTSLARSNSVAFSLELSLARDVCSVSCQSIQSARAKITKRNESRKHLEQRVNDTSRSSGRRKWNKSSSLLIEWLYRWSEVPVHTHTPPGLMGMLLFSEDQSEHDDDDRRLNCQRRTTNVFMTMNKFLVITSIDDFLPKFKQTNKSTSCFLNLDGTRKKSPSMCVSAGKARHTGERLARWPKTNLECQLARELLFIWSYQ